MLKIVEVHAAGRAGGEYIVLQNQGLVSVNLRGWALCTDAYLEGDPGSMASQMFIFRDDIDIKPYTRVVLFTACGENSWMPTIDGRQAYCAYWQRKDRVWSDAAHIHVLHMLSSISIQKPPALAVPA